MSSRDLKLPKNHKKITDRFRTACKADERVVAAFIGGSYAEDNADEFSDLDLYLITTDEAYDEFLAYREKFVRLLGEPLFLEDFGEPHALFCTFSDNSEFELWVGHESSFNHIYSGSYIMLLDKKEILVNVVFPHHEAEFIEQVEVLRQQVNWFWHEVSHFIKAMGRGQLWFAYGQLEAMRQICINLARLKHNFSDAYVGDEPYFKVDQILPVNQLSPLQTTFCALDYEAMLQSALVIVRFYQNVATILANTYPSSIRYQADLERMMINQLKQLSI